MLTVANIWQAAISFRKHGFSRVEDPAAFQRYLIRQAEKRLETLVGEKYKNIVVKRLQGDFGIKDDTKEELKLQQAFRDQVVDVLERSPENI